MNGRNMRKGGKIRNKKNKSEERKKQWKKGKN